MSNQIAGTYEVTPAAGYAGDVSPKTAWKILSERKDAVLIDVRTRPFYGFGGAWGEVGNISDTTGPLGPSQYK